MGLRLNANKEHKLKIASKRENLARVEALVEKICRAISFSEDERDSIAIAVTEMVNNAMIHGNKLDPNKFVHITITPLDNGIAIRIRDEGNGFDPDKVPNPLAPENLLKESGRGIFIVKSLMDDVKYDFSSGGAEITMIKYKKD